MQDFCRESGAVGMQIANVKQRQILPRVGNQIWMSTPRNRTIGVNLRKSYALNPSGPVGSVS